MLKITSKENTRLRRLSRLYASGRERRENGLFVLEGVRLVRDAVENGVPVREVYVTRQGIARLGERFSMLSLAADELFEIDETLSRRIGDTEHPQGVFAVCEGSLLTDGLPEDLSAGCLLLCSLQDPGNVGTILRTAAAFGLPVVMTADCPAPDSPKVLRAAMGVRHAWRMPSAVCAVEALRLRGVPVLAAALEDDSLPVEKISLRGAAVAVGNEGAGLSGEVIERCSGRVILPMEPGCESLNAAAAASVFAWELYRAKRGLRV